MKTSNQNQPQQNMENIRSLAETTCFLCGLIMAILHCTHKQNDYYPFQTQSILATIAILSIIAAIFYNIRTTKNPIATKKTEEGTGLKPVNSHPTYNLQACKTILIAPASDSNQSTLRIPH